MHKYSLHRRAVPDGAIEICWAKEEYPSSASSIIYYTTRKKISPGRRSLVTPNQCMRRDRPTTTLPRRTFIRQLRKRVEASRDRPRDRQFCLLSLCQPQQACVSLQQRNGDLGTIQSDSSGCSDLSTYMLVWVCGRIMLVECRRREGGVTCASTSTHVRQVKAGQGRSGQVRAGSQSKRVRDDLDHRLRGTWCRDDQRWTRLDQVGPGWTVPKAPTPPCLLEQDCGADARLPAFGCD